MLLTGCVSGNSAKPLPYLRAQGDYFMQAGIKSYEQYNYELATDQFNQAKSFYSRFDDYQGETNALLNLAKTNIDSGKLLIAEQNLIASRNLIDRFSLKPQNTYLDLLLTTLYLNKGRLDEASSILASYHNSLHEPVLDDLTLSLLINRVKLSQLINQDFSEWASVLNKHSTTHTNDEITARAHRFNAALHFINKDFERGNEYFNNAINIYRQMANPGGLMSTQIEWAMSYVQLNEPLNAIGHYEQALKLALANRNFHNGVVALDGLRSIYQNNGDIEKLHQIDGWLLDLKSLTAESLED